MAVENKEKEKIRKHHTPVGLWLFHIGFNRQSYINAFKVVLIVKIY